MNTSDKIAELRGRLGDRRTGHGGGAMTPWVDDTPVKQADDHLDAMRRDLEPLTTLEHHSIAQRVLQRAQDIRDLLAASEAEGDRLADLLIEELRAPEAEHAEVDDQGVW